MYRKCFLHNIQILLIKCKWLYLNKNRTIWNIINHYLFTITNNLCVNLGRCVIKFKMKRDRLLKLSCFAKIDEQKWDFLCNAFQPPNCKALIVNALHIRPEIYLYSKMAAKLSNYDMNNFDKNQKCLIYFSTLP